MLYNYVHIWMTTMAWVLSVLHYVISGDIGYNIFVLHSSQVINMFADVPASQSIRPSVGTSLTEKSSMFLSIFIQAISDPVLHWK